MVGVDRRHHLLRRRRAGLQRGQHLALPLLAMGQVLAELRVGVPDHRAMAGADHGGAQRQHRIQRPQVVGQVAVGRIDHARAPPQDGISREQDPGAFL